MTLSKSSAQTATALFPSQTVSICVSFAFTLTAVLNTMKWVLVEQNYLEVSVTRNLFWLCLFEFLLCLKEMNNLLPPVEADGVRIQ